VSLPGGTGELVESLIKAMTPGTVSLSRHVADIHRHTHYRVETAAGPVEARAVILAVPAYVAASLLRVFDTSIAALAEAIPYASTATVALGYRREQVPHPMAGSGFVVPRAERSPLLAATWVTSKWPHRAPDGHVLLRGFLGGGRDPRRLDADDDELIALVTNELRDLLEITGEPLFTRLYRWTRQSPQYEVGHLQRVATIDRQLASIPGLFVTGSGFRAIGIPDCIADGRETAAKAAAFVATMFARN
jgi:oxygen-dependent protoporphyrinogen oxidase